MKRLTEPRTFIFVPPSIADPGGLNCLVEKTVFGPVWYTDYSVLKQLISEQEEYYRQQVEDAKKSQAIYDELRASGLSEEEVIARMRPGTESEQ